MRFHKSHSRGTWQRYSRSSALESWFGVVMLMVVLVIALNGCQLLLPPTVLAGAGPVLSIEFPSTPALTQEETIAVHGTAYDEDGVVSVKIGALDADTPNDFSNWSVRTVLQAGDNEIIVESEDALGNTSTLAFVIRRRGPSLLGAKDIAFDFVANRALIVDSHLPALVAVDASDGTSVVISSDTKGHGPALREPVSVAFYPGTSQVFVVDAGRKALMAIDLSSGERSIVSGPAKGEGPDFSSPSGVTFDVMTQRALVVDGGLNALLAIDLENGHRSIISDESHGTGRDLDKPIDVVFDAVNDRALIAEQNALVAVAMDGTRTVVSDSEKGAGLPLLQDVRGIALDEFAKHAIVVDGATQTVIAIELGTGDRFVRTGGEIGEGPVLEAPEGIMLRSGGEVALVLDKHAVGGGIILVRLDSGVRSELPLSYEDPVDPTDPVPDPGDTPEPVPDRKDSPDPVPDPVPPPDPFPTPED